MKSGLAADDGVALHFIGTKLAHCVSSRQNVSAYHVTRAGRTVREEKVEARYLGGKGKR